MRSGAYAYRKFFKNPLKLYKIGKGDKAIVFSKGIEIRQIIVALLIFSVLFLFRGSIGKFLPGTLELAFYAVLPWAAAGAVCKSKLDGKRLHSFFYGYFRYLYNRRFCHSSHKPVYRQQTAKTQCYEKFH